MATRLKILLNQRHWQSYTTFTREYDKVATQIDPALVYGGPSRTQLHRWMAGDLKKLPYADHCRILEGMFPGWTAEQLLGPADDEVPTGRSGVRPSDELVSAVRSGLDAPGRSDATWGVAPRASLADALVSPATPNQRGASASDDMSRRLVALKHALRLSDEDTQRLAALAGHVVELSLTGNVTIEPDGRALISYTHELLNLTTTPLKRLSREIWFKHSHSPLTITPIAMDERRMMIQRTHDAPQMSKFACQMSPAVEPGEVARIGYTFEGGLFTDELYWRQSFTRHTKHFTLNVRHRNARVMRCSAIEQLTDGSELLATDDILWDYDGDDATMSVARDYLCPDQALTLRWEIERAAT